MSAEQTQTTDDVMEVECDEVTAAIFDAYCDRRFEGRNYEACRAAALLLCGEARRADMEEAIGGFEWTRRAMG